MSQYTRQAKSMNQDNVVEFERGSMSQDYRGSGRKPKKESKKKRRSKKKSKKSENGGVKIEEVPSEVSCNVTWFTSTSSEGTCI